MIRRYYKIQLNREFQNSRLLVGKSMSAMLALKILTYTPVGNIWCSWLAYKWPNHNLREEQRIAGLR